MDENLDAIRKELKKYSQEHLLTEYERLDETKQKQLLDQIKGIDFGLINSLYNNTRKEFNEKDSQITPIEYLDKNKLNGYYKSFQETGESAIRAGKLAAVTMAGGQGTRLGHTGPKGTFKLDVYGKGKYLFEILAENLKEANKIIGNTYKQIRKSKKFTQEEVAEKSDLTPEYLSKFENGKYNASIYNIILLCKAIDTNPTQLFNQFFDDNSAAIITTITDELKDMDVSDQKLILILIKRKKKKANI